MRTGAAEGKSYLCPQQKDMQDCITMHIFHIDLKISFHYSVLKILVL
jgi:hypothetical protein